VQCSRLRLQALVVNYVEIQILLVLLLFLLLLLLLLVFVAIAVCLALFGTSYHPSPCRICHYRLSSSSTHDLFSTSL